MVSSILDDLISASFSKLFCAVLLELLSQAVFLCLGTSSHGLSLSGHLSPLPNRHLIVPQMCTLDQVSFAMLSHM